jgi:hypothetical protein
LGVGHFATGMPYRHGVIGGGANLGRRSHRRRCVE